MEPLSLIQLFVDLSIFILSKYTFLYHSNRLLKSCFLIKPRKGGYVIEVRKKKKKTLEFCLSRSAAHQTVRMCVCVERAVRLCCRVQRRALWGTAMSQKSLADLWGPQRSLSILLLCVGFGALQQPFPSLRTNSASSDEEAETSACACEGRPFQTQQLKTSSNQY